MKTRIFFAAFIAVSFVVTSACDIVGGDYMVYDYCIYITGDTGRTVQISYLERGLVKNTGHGQGSYSDGTIPEYVGGDDNVVIAEAVTLPFFKEINYVSNRQDEQDRFLEIASTNDSTTKAIMFHSDVVLADTFCDVADAFNTSYGVSDECAYCKSLSTDSILNYLKAVKYPCYIEFSQGDTQKRVSLSGVGKWMRETGLYFDNTKH
ncbi:MAG: hypothetical protein LBO71_10945 [Prevotellaceae bacterium]|jgi:hypothetical protein|nr:hypothetical protein [Prevotellaceae bacterium]